MELLAGQIHNKLNSHFFDFTDKPFTILESNSFLI
jgi:hypothetical protein